jgi:hypothetical protein
VATIETADYTTNRGEGNLRVLVEAVGEVNCGVGPEAEQRSQLAFDRIVGRILRLDHDAWRLVDEHETVRRRRLICSLEDTDTLCR